jgi:putative transposase
MANNLKTQLVLDALDMAIHRRKPTNVIHHSDQGCQYTSVALAKRCEEVGVRPSMGSVGRLLRQRHVREFQRDTRVRIAR